MFCFLDFGLPEAKAAPADPDNSGQGWFSPGTRYFSYLTATNIIQN